MGKHRKRASYKKQKSKQTVTHFFQQRKILNRLHKLENIAKAWHETNKNI